MEEAIFKNGSTTYYWSSRFFPKSIREDVFRFYSFVRVVDDYVDQSKPDVKALNELRGRWRTAQASPNFSTDSLAKDSKNDRVIKNIVYIVRKYSCSPEWVEAFFASMEMDVKCRKYNNLSDTLEYIYGSAEVIGLFMARIMSLPETAYEAAKMQGRAMQFVNFIRDVDEDNHLGRQYFPADLLRVFGLENLSKSEAKKKPEQFAQFMNEQIRLYRQWQEQANTGFVFIPRRLRVPLRTAVDMYNWTAKQIEQDPMVVFSRKVKPHKRRVLRTVLKRVFWA